jgi:hypothetical protein
MLATTPPLLPTGVRLKHGSHGKRTDVRGGQTLWRGRKAEKLERETFLAVVKDAGLGSFLKFFAVTYRLAAHREIKLHV